jgi:very-short-patch-repair endonuclease
MAMSDKAASQSMARLAADQHGVVSAMQLRKLGWKRSKIANEVSANRLHRLHRGVYAVGHRALTREARSLAAVLSCGPDALLSHLSAAWLWGISTRLPAVPEVTVTGSVRHARADIRVHSAGTFDSTDHAIADGIPVTAVARTLLDVAGAAEGNVRWALPRAKRRGLLDVIAIDAVLSRSAGMRGAARLRDALDRYRTRAFTRSDLERDFLRLVEREGLPRPSMNLFICGYELDAYWANVRFAVELDTYDYHGDEISFEEDRMRQEDLKLAGIEMVRVTGRRMDREPTAVASRLRNLLEQRRKSFSR